MPARPPAGVTLAVVLSMPHPLPAAGPRPAENTRPGPATPGWSS
jgi:hypothetical protein